MQIGKLLYRPPKLIRVKAGSPVRILFLTDLHLRPSHPEMIGHVLSACRNTRPELIALGGDLTEYDNGLELFLSALRREFPEIPICAVPGNNDDRLFGGDRDKQSELYAGYGVVYLPEKQIMLNIGGHAVNVAGTEDAYTHVFHTGKAFPEENGCYRILLSHAPHACLLEEMPDLMLCGHTHGGQINVLGLTCYLLLRYERQYSFAALAGEKRLGRTFLLVSRGIGYSKYPLRFGARSEIHLIE